MFPVPSPCQPPACHLPYAICHLVIWGPGWDPNVPDVSTPYVVVLGDMTGSVLPVQPSAPRAHNQMSSQGQTGIPRGSDHPPATPSHCFRVADFQVKFPLSGAIVGGSPTTQPTPSPQPPGLWRCTPSLPGFPAPPSSAPKHRFRSLLLCPLPQPQTRTTGATDGGDIHDDTHYHVTLTPGWGGKGTYVAPDGKTLDFAWPSNCVIPTQPFSWAGHGQRTEDCQLLAIGGSTKIRKGGVYVSQIPRNLVM